MTNLNSITAVRQADIMAQTLHASGAFAAAAHRAAAAIAPRKPRTGTAIVASVKGTP